MVLYCCCGNADPCGDCPGSADPGTPDIIPGEAAILEALGFDLLSIYLSLLLALLS